MVILDKPYVSTYMQNTLKSLGIPVLDNTRDECMLTVDGLNLLSEQTFIDQARTKTPLLLYCNSENSIRWIDQNLCFTGIPQKIELFKDKVRFRGLLQAIYPDFYFQEIAYDQISTVDISDIPKPFIIKPAIGFFSMGVHKVEDEHDWLRVKEQIKDEMTQVQGLYPKEVMNASRFIIEECIDGEEFAIDAYFDNDGKPVILNILKHPFSSAKDVSDRLYFTSKKIMKEHLGRFEKILVYIGKLGNVRNFPIHMEVRVDRMGSIVPIEVNPMRFAGWCTTDIAQHAYGINVYEYYFQQKAPDWGHILQEDDGMLTCLVLADIPNSINPSEISSIDYAQFIGEFKKLYELRKIDYLQYPVFAFAFIGLEKAETIESILGQDLTKYIVLKQGSSTP